MGNILHVKDAHNSLSQSQLMDQGIQIVTALGYRIQIYDKLPPEDSACGQG